MWPLSPLGTTSLLLSLALPQVLAQSVDLSCTADRPLALCAQYLNPFSANNYTWREECGILTSSATMLMAEGLAFPDNNNACASGYAPTCCKSCLACGKAGVDCTGSPTGLPPTGSISSASLPAGWRIAIPCAVDNEYRILSDIAVTYLASTTPTSCITLCAAEGYTYAGLEYGDECYCGNGYIGGTPPSAGSEAECDVRCSGDYRFTCGGSWRMQVYTSEAQ